ncbi:GlxA family transcriptional regulator [Rhizobium halophytocola]|uniref:Transcriptional regulator GlxA family with amidase domain n=1 Tax=Rhizobium halophytocola TaxID=735519 RepID=A0ABS4DVC1_9HYPH|nr:GlxA family transcriptional regulator [Rhizobium halophytocola]MBP1849653.1 transcriptional regulator GlxA family with amidase domain [Rhizobium halophytocola]
MDQRSPAQNPKTAPPPAKVLKVGFVLARSFTLSAFSLFVDALRLGSDEADRSRRIHCDWEVLSSSRHLLTSSCGIQLSPTASLKPPQEFSYIAVIGGRLNVEEPIDRETIAYLHKAVEAGVPVIGVCTGSFILADNGLLEDRLACVSWLHYREFLERFPDNKATSHSIFVEDGNIITCAGGSSVADLAAFLIRRHVGPAAERNALEILQIIRRRDATEVQPRNPLASGSYHDKRIGAALLLMEQHVENVLSVEKIARRIGVSRRQLERIFLTELNLSPAVAYQRIRLEEAMRLVTGTDRPLIEIALETGFENTSHFNRRFKKAFSVTPNALRRQNRSAVKG